MTHLLYSLGKSHMAASCAVLLLAACGGDQSGVVAQDGNGGAGGANATTSSMAAGGGIAQGGGTAQGGGQASPCGDLDCGPGATCDETSATCVCEEGYYGDDPTSGCQPIPVPLGWIPTTMPSANPPAKATAVGTAAKIAANIAPTKTATRAPFAPLQRATAAATAFRVAIFRSIPTAKAAGRVTAVACSLASDRLPRCGPYASPRPGATAKPATIHSTSTATTIVTLR